MHMVHVLENNLRKGGVIMEGNTNLSKALAEVQGAVKAAYKSGENTYDKYPYAKLEDYIDAVKEPCSKSGVWYTFDETEPKDLPNRTMSSNKTEYVVRMHVIMTIGHVSGETMQLNGWGEGQDRGDKAMYKAITGAKKYLMANAFAIPTTDDPEQDSHGDEQPAKKQQAPEKQRAAEPPKSAPAKPKPSNVALPAGKSERFREIDGQKCINDDYQKKNKLITGVQIRSLKATRDSADAAGAYTKDEHYAFCLRAYFGPHKVTTDKSMYLADIRSEWYDEITMVSKDNPEIVTATGDDATA